MAESEAKPPIGQQSSVTGGTGILQTWGSFIETREMTPELTWPRSRDTYDVMFNDAQVRGLLLSMVLPILRYRWSIDPMDASGTVVERVQQDLGLPLLGEEPARRLRNKNRFNFAKYAELAITTALKQGHFFAEQVAQYDEQNKARLRKLAPIMPHTITDIKIESDGGLRHIEQPGDNVMQVKIIPVTRLVAHIWDQEPGNWVGRSMLRSMYKAWLIKDRVIRVGAINIEKAGDSAPIFEAPQGATPTEIAALGTMAQKLKAGEQSGAAVPYGTRRLPGSGQQSNAAVEYIHLMNEEMARSSLQMFMQLGQTQTGSRSMFEAGVDYFGFAQQAVAEWFTQIFNDHVIEDMVDWNEGSDEPAPAIVFEPNTDPNLSIQDLESMVRSGLITVGPEIEDWLRKMKRMPTKPVQEEQAPAGQPFGYDLDSGIITIDERRAQLGLDPRPDGLGSLTVPEFLAKFGGTGTGAVEGTNVPAEDPATDVAGEGSPRPSFGTESTNRGRGSLNPIQRLRERRAKAEEDALRLPARDLRRKPYPHEIEAKVDYRAMDEEWEAARDRLVENWQDVKAAQIDDLVDAISDADGDVKVLAEITAEMRGNDTLFGEMVDMADKSANAAVQEGKKQGAKLAKPKLDDKLIQNRADAVAEVMSRSISEAAARKSINLTNDAGSLSPTQVAAEVREYLEGLSDAYLKDQLGGAVTQAQNYARFEVINNGPAAEIYSSELLDAATCSECAGIDGHQYDSIDDAQSDYPTGGYKDCAGGPRCRGTLIAVYNAETGATR